jgi:ATP-binding cassette subfamily B protein
LSEAAEKLGLQSVGLKLSFDDLVEAAPFPCIAYWQQRHFIVIYKVKKDKVFVADPAHGLQEYSTREFLQGWAVDGNSGIILSLDPSPVFDSIEEDKQAERNVGFIFSYLGHHRTQLLQVFLGLLAGSLLQLVVPFLTQSLVDIGIRHHDLSFIYLILFAQLMVYSILAAGSTSVYYLTFLPSS